MKTLYDRLKPELKEALESKGKIYTATFRVVKKALTKNHYWSDLKIQEAMNLCNLLDIVFSVDNLYNIFNYESN